MAFSLLTIRPRAQELTHLDRSLVIHSPLDRLPGHDPPARQARQQPVRSPGKAFDRIALPRVRLDLDQRTARTKDNPEGTANHPLQQRQIRPAQDDAAEKIRATAGRERAGRASHAVPHGEQRGVVESFPDACSANCDVRQRRRRSQIRTQFSPCLLYSANSMRSDTKSLKFQM